jgi:hypothetical protein
MPKSAQFMDDVNVHFWYKSVIQKINLHSFGYFLLGYFTNSQLRTAKFITLPWYDFINEKGYQEVQS